MKNTVAAVVPANVPVAPVAPANIPAVPTRSAVKFSRKNDKIMDKALSHTGLPESEWDIVKTDLALQYEKDGLGFDPERGVKESTFVYMKAKCRGIDEFRKEKLGRFVELNSVEALDSDEDCDGKWWEEIPDERTFSRAWEDEDIRFVVKEALNRLYNWLEHHSEDKDSAREQLEVLVRQLTGEKREVLHRDYGRAEDNISLIKTRLISLLNYYCKQVDREDYDGKLKLSPDRVWFLKKYIGF